MTKGEVVFWSVFVVVFGVGLLGASNCSYAYTKEEYLAKVTSKMEVPEPIDMIFWEAPFQEFGVFLPKTATIHYDKKDGHWKMVINEDWWNEAPYNARLRTLGHEVCHAVYDHDILIPDLWYEIPDHEIERRQTRAGRCSAQIIRRLNRGD
jgi:hypothetical protein